MRILNIRGADLRQGARPKNLGFAYVVAAVLRHCSNLETPPATLKAAMERRNDRLCPP
jgi:hypothetical protein